MPDPTGITGAPAPLTERAASSIRLSRAIAIVVATMAAVVMAAGAALERLAQELDALTHQLAHMGDAAPA